MHRYMLDTNIVIYVIKRRPVEMLSKFNAQLGRMVISSVTLAELYYGAEKSQFPDRNLRVVEDFVSRLDVLSYDARAAFHYGAIRADLERKGTPVGANDLHIAAHARSAGLTLVTNNLREFNRVEGLLSENWL